MSWLKIATLAAIPLVGVPVGIAAIGAWILWDVDRSEIAYDRARSTKKEAKKKRLKEKPEGEI